MNRKLIVLSILSSQLLQANTSIQPCEVKSLGESVDTGLSGINPTDIDTETKLEPESFQNPIKVLPFEMIELGMHDFGA